MSIKISKHSQITATQTGISTWVVRVDGKTVREFTKMKQANECIAELYKVRERKKGIPDGWEHMDPKEAVYHLTKPNKD